MNSSSRPVFRPALEGIRGYAFLLVFAVHYVINHVPEQTFGGDVLQVLILLSRAAVPLFFVLSGYLITGITFQTRDRPGFFRVYYWRRALRVFPVYYACLALGLLLAWLTSMHFDPKRLLLLVFLHNFSSTSMGLNLRHAPVQVAHLWSMAVEEQFYLLWPIAVWFLRKRVPLLVLCYLGIAVVNIVRLNWPLHPFNPLLADAMTMTRADGILLGCALALHRQDGRSGRWSAWAARLAMTASIVMLIFGHTAFREDCSYLSITVLYPLLNIIGLSLLILALEEGWWQRMCCLPTARFLGRISYGLYAFHLLYINWFDHVLVLRLERSMPLTLAVGVSALAAFGLTLVLALACQRWIEVPILRLRSRVDFGVRSAKVRAERAEMLEPTLARLLRMQPQAHSRIPGLEGASVS